MQSVEPFRGECLRRGQVLPLELLLQLLGLWSALAVGSCSLEDVIDRVVIGRFLGQVKLCENF